MECRWRHLRGTTLLRQFLSDARLTERPSDGVGMTELAARLGVKTGTVYTWTIGYRRPSADFRLALARIAGIPENSWKTARERQRSDKLRAA